MDSFKLLIETHLKTNKLEKEIRKTRGKLIKAYKNKDSSQSSELYTLKISYTGFAAQLNKETATFDTLVNDLDKINFINNHYNNINQYSELIDNINDSSSSISEEQPEVTTFYSDNNNNSPVVTDKDTSNISFETQSKQTEKPETETVLELFNNSVAVIVSENENENEPASVVVNNTNTNDDIVDNDNNDNSVRSSSENYKPSKISKIRSGYKYGGKGFDVFTCYRNKCQPIYSSTLLFCNETCNENKDKLKQFLIEFGKFNEKMIEEIIFKRRGSYERYALIKVRGKLNYIKKKIQNMKRTKGNNILHIFKRSQTMSASEWQYMNNILYVNNFDIFNRNTHKKFTQLFLKYGELVKDVKMGLDSNKDPYAIVHFRDLEDAKECIKSFLVFGGKVLNVKFSRF